MWKYETLAEKVSLKRVKIKINENKNKLNIMLQIFICIANTETYSVCLHFEKIIFICS